MRIVFGLLYPLVICSQDNPTVDPNYYKRGILISTYVWDGTIVAWCAHALYKLTKFKRSNVLQRENGEKNTSSWNDFANYPLEGDLSPPEATNGITSIYETPETFAARSPLPVFTSRRRRENHRPWRHVTDTFSRIPVYGRAGV